MQPHPSLRELRNETHSEFTGCENMKHTIIVQFNWWNAKGKKAVSFSAAATCWEEGEVCKAFGVVVVVLRGFLGLSTLMLCVRRDCLAGSRSQERGRWELGTASCFPCWFKPGEAHTSSCYVLGGVWCLQDTWWVSKSVSSFLTPLVHCHNPFPGSWNKDDHSKLCLLCTLQY